MSHIPGQLGTPLDPRATRVLLLGAGELGKEVAIELQRLGAEVIAADRYPHAPAMQVAHRSHVVDMLDPTALRMLLLREQPQLVIPEIEALNTQVLVDAEGGNRRVIPTARAVALTMNREGIRRLAAEALAVPTSPYAFVDSLADLEIAVGEIGMPCVVKPVQSSSGRGQTVIPAYDAGQHRAAVSSGLGAAVLDHQFDWARRAWAHAQSDARGLLGTGEAPTRVIVEGFVDFDYEITLLTVRSRCPETGETLTSFCPPIGHRQQDGDYRESWTPAPMSPAALARAHAIATLVTEALGGWGVFGVELFVRGDEVLFNEVSPRPHDTGLVTLVSQDVSQFAMHARAVLGLPAGEPGPVGGPGQEFAASCAVLATGSGVPRYDGVDLALTVPTVQVRLFGKPRVDGTRRVGVTLARGASLDEARARAVEAAAHLTVSLV
ncbi:MAG: phosphoribosylglycinamide formyltransferase 2 [Promicromonosporaceae bacterium]|nr:phosphoribosylglycinamide formyltransferase 2 [Promicromonosporaceae bacterium]